MPLRRSRIARLRSPRLARLAVLVGLGLAAAPAAGETDLNDLALDWARGSFAAPLLCEIDGTPRRVARRVLVAPGRADAQPRVDRIRFHRLGVEKASRCFDAFGVDQREVAGVLLVTLPGTSRPDFARREFALALRRDQGFAFSIQSGSLRLEPVAAGGPPGEDVDFSGGTAWLRLVTPGTDTARLLQDIPSPRKLVLELEAPGGRRLSFPLVQTGAR
jgi:hypothetical protein